MAKKDVLCGFGMSEDSLDFLKRVRVFLGFARLVPGFSKVFLRVFLGFLKCKCVSYRWVEGKKGREGGIANAWEGKG